MCLQVMNTAMVLTVPALTLISTGHARVEALAVLLVAVCFLASATNAVNPSLALTQHHEHHLLVDVTLKTVRILRLHHRDGVLSLLLVTRVVVAVVARAVAVTVLLALETRAVQLQAMTLSARATRRALSLPRQTPHLGRNRSCDACVIVFLLDRALAL